ncbi:MAG: IS4 family transposase [Oscillospiraceae bacterium]|nr:IS4 family transposase [Oscillospiraceae bacterium]
MVTIRYWEEIEKYLPEGWEAKSRELGAFARGREIKTPSDLLMVNLLHMTAGESYQATSSMLRLTAGMSLNKNAVYERILKSGEWLQWLAREVCVSSGYMAEKPEWLGEKRVMLVDASDVALKGSKTSDYRMHYVFDLFGFTCETFEITTIKEGEKLTRYSFSENDIVVADRIYGTIQGIEHMNQTRSDFVLRFKSKAFILYDSNGEKIDLLERIRHLKEWESADVDCYYKVNGQLRPIRICAMKKNKRAIEQSRRRVEKKASRKQEKEVTKETLELNEYIVLATSLDYDCSQIFELYRARWQIEMVFYRLKSLFGFGDVPSKKPESVKAWFFGKLFLAALCEAIEKDSHFSPVAKTEELPFPL